MNYILVDKKPVFEPDFIKWAQWFESTDRHVALTHLKKFAVSTVFLGIDHNFFKSGLPILFETMVFSNDDGHSEDYQERYSTWEEAEAGHQRAVDSYSRIPLKVVK